MVSLSDLHRIPRSELQNGDRLNRRKITGVSTDSRAVAPGDLFIALRGAQFDGHAFIGDAVSRGAVAVMMDATGLRGREPDVPRVLVPDTTRALGDLAAIYRSKLSLPIVAIGGSNGKTTSKDMVAAVLGTTYAVLSTEGNLNNHIGVPLTIFRITRKHDCAVVELGTNHPGEIRYLCEILRPTHGLVTNIGREHLEFFGSLEGVAEEELTLWDERVNPGITRFLNTDDPVCVRRARGMRRTIRYGFAGRANDVKGSRLRVGDDGCAVFSLAGKRVRAPFEVRVSVPGRHNASNALAAAAVALTLRVTPRRIREALGSFRPTSKRMEMFTLNGVVIVNDTYNANPDSTAAALRTLAEMRIPGKRIAVLGDMLELGPGAEFEHARIGALAAELKIDFVLTLGALARHIARGAAASTAVHYDQKNVLSEYLLELVGPGDAVLVKGSRGMKMEDVVTFLSERLRYTTAH